jgi:aryl-alcohol dehydrogenase-like predicted oxidoreductase
MEYRTLGRTGEKLSIIGMGGIVVDKLTQAEADAVVAEAIDRGVNYFDVAPSYGDAELRLGPALVGRRKHVFLACKTGKRTAAEATAELDRSLKRLQTGHVDLYQMHGLDKPEDLEIALGPGGAMEAFEATRDAGKIRFIGITGHAPSNLVRALASGRFDTALFPVNYAQFEIASSGPEVIEAARSAGAGRLAIKAAAQRRWGDGEARTAPKCWYKPLDDRDALLLALRYALSQDITAALPPGDTELFRTALSLADGFEPVSQEDIVGLRAASSQLAPLFGPTGAA